MNFTPPRYKVIVAGVAVIVIAVLTAGCGSTHHKAAASSEAATEKQIAQALQQAEQTAPASEQDNAVQAAQDYLGSQAFSRSDLISQLKYDGYSQAEAVYAVNHISVDWYEQAAESAKEYLSSQPFSRSDLISQLEYDGFTPAQARYGVNATGL
jgi:outer membrane PBP1 activator LpoA protein